MRIEWGQIFTSVAGGAILGGASAFFLLHGRVSNLEGRVEALDRAADPQRIENLVKGFVGAHADEETGHRVRKPSSLAEATNSTQGHSPEELPATVMMMTVPTKADFPLKGPTVNARGTHSLPLGAHVWATLEDSYGNFYLQNPPVALHSDETWTAILRPGKGITGVAIVLANASANDVFEQKVRNEEWGGFRLPEGAKIVARAP